MLPPSVTGGNWPGDVSCDMFDVRRVSVLHLEVPFLKLSEQQHGSSWARRSLQTMGNLSLVFL